MFKVILTLNIKALLPVLSCFGLFMCNCFSSTTWTSIQLPGPRAERGRWRRKTQRTHKADPKRRKKSGKSEKESVSNSLIDYVKWIFFFFFRFSFHIRWRGSSNKDIVEILVIIKSRHLSIRTTLSMTMRRAKKPNAERMRMGPVSVYFLSLKNLKELSAKQEEHKIKINVSQHFVLRCLQKQQEHKSFLWLPAVGREREEQKIQII